MPLFYLNSLKVIFNANINLNYLFFKIYILTN